MTLTKAQLREMQKKQQHLDETQRAEQEQRRKDLEQLKKMLVSIQPARTTVQSQRMKAPKPDDIDEAKRRLMRATGTARPNHQYGELVGGAGCDRCPRGSLYRYSQADHPFLIQEEP